MRRDDVRFAVAAREDGLRRVRRLTFRIGAAAVACSAAIAVAFSHLSGSAAASGQAPGTGSGQAAGSGGGAGSSSSGGSQSGGNPAGSGTQRAARSRGAARCRSRRRMWPRPRGRPREFRGAHDRGGRHGAGRGSLAAALPHLGGPEAIVVTSSTPLWYITRATGVVALVLLTTGMALGLLIAVRFEGRQWPRFITIGLHRNLSLLALAFTVAHVLTTISDNFVPIDLQDALVPFISPYRPLWLGLGAIAFDLLIALTVTSLLRARLGHRSWRLVHWTAYLCWPVAVLHGLGTGSDTRTRWVLVVTLLCVVAIACLTGWRLADGWPAHPKVRVAGAIALVAVLAGGGAWLMTGPLRPGWSLHAGLPALTHISRVTP